MRKTKNAISMFLLKGVTFLMILLLSISFVYILGWILVQSFNTPLGFMKKPFSFVNLSDLSFDSYIKAFTLNAQRTSFLEMLLNSLILVGIDVFMGALFLPPLCGYILARYEFPGKNLMISIIIITATIPTIGATPITYSLITKMGLLDSFLAIFVMSLNCFGFGLVIMMNYFKGLHGELMEAAALDGAGRMQTYIRVMFPQAKGLLGVNVILQFIGTWNDYMRPYLYLPSHPTLALGMDLVRATVVQQGQDYPTLFAYMIFMVGVVTILYIIFNKQISTNLYTSALK